METKPRKGRGSASNTDNRFERLSYRASDDKFEYKQEDPGAEEPSLRTQFFQDSSRSIITHNKSPDIGFESSLNPYRGCEHGCAYCYARPTHEYLGMSAGLDFETKIVVKEDAPKLLRKELMSKKWDPQVLMMSGVTDCYQPIERKLKITRGCLEVLVEFRNPVMMITKNHLVTRDIDLLSDLARDEAAAVFITITTLDAELCTVLEPRTSRPQFRLDAIKQLNEARIPVGVMIAPVIPGLTDHEIPAILKAAKLAGARSAGMTMLRLPYSVSPLFQEWVKLHRPERVEKIIHQIQSIRGGKMNDSTFGTRMRGEGVLAEQINQLFKISRLKEGLDQGKFALSTKGFKRPEVPEISQQLKLF